MERRKYKMDKITKRRKLNLLNFVFSLCVLFLAAKVASADFTARINKISDDLNKALGDVLKLEGPNYTDMHESATYYSNNTFNPKGMAILYNTTTKFMDVLIAKDVQMEGLFKVHNKRIEVGTIDDQWKNLLANYGAVLAIIIALLLFAILMPLCGLCFCCSRCCCGSRSKPFDKKGDLCRKICLASLLIIVGTLMLFGVVCAFVSNQHMQDGTNDLPNNWKTTLKDTDTYLEATSKEINILLNINYYEFEKLLFGFLDKCSNIVLDQLREYSKATALTEVVRIVNGLDDIKSNLTFMKVATNELRINASQLNDGLRKAKRDLLQILHECNRLNECNEISDKYINQLGTDIDFNNLPDISEEINQLSVVLDSDITGTVRKGQDAFDNIRVEINRTISSQIPKVKKSVRVAGKEITAGGSNVTKILEKVREALNNFSHEPLTTGNRYLREYSPYRYYIGLGISCVLLIVTLCIALGLVCGVCGKRPDAYSDDCCNKGAGSRFLMIGVAIMFLFATILALVAIIYFFVGIFAQRIVCDSIRNPEKSQVLKFVDALIDTKDTVGADVNLGWTLNACHKNMSIYKVLKLENHFELNDPNTYLTKFDINRTLNDLTNQINANTSVVILSEKAKSHLEELVESGIAEISYDKFTDELAHNLTSVDLGFLADKLVELEQVVKDKVSGVPDLYSRLMLCSLHLRTYQVTYVEPMSAKSKQLMVVAQNLKESLKFEKMSFKHAIHDLIEELEGAQRYLRLNGSHTMTEIANKFGRGIESQVRGYLNRVINNTRDNVGRCGPMSSVLNSTLVASCDKVLLPLNGFWFSIMWCLALFIPTIILSVKLATLYQKYEPYPGPLVEAEYLYDAYTDRDNIPLNSSIGDNRPKKKNKKKQKRFDGRGAYSAEPTNDIAREMPGGSRYQDARYSDMAPKHWEEFPAGGPPQYQRAPTEYERPPPYYYPGTEQQQ